MAYLPMRNQTSMFSANFSNTSDDPFVYDRVFNEPAFISIYVCIFVPSVICNGLVCWIVKQNRSMHTNTNYLLVNLAVADMMATILSIFHVVDYLAIDLHLGLVLIMLFTIAGNHKQREINFFKPVDYRLIILCCIGDIACKFRKTLVSICHGTSVFTLTSIAHERYYAICKPLTNRLRRTSVKWIIPQCWLLAIFIHIPSMIYCGTQVEKYKQSSCTCHELFPSLGVARAYAISRYLIVYVLPLVVVIYRYTAIIRQLRHQSSNDGESGFTSQESKKHVVKMLIASSIFFFVAWTPFYTSYLLKDTGIDKRSVYSFVWYFSMLLALSNCAYNPVIYCLLSRNFRHGFHAVFCWCYRRRQVSPLRNGMNINLSYTLPYKK